MTFRPLMLLPLLTFSTSAFACPLCFAATPFRAGLLGAAIFLLPIPFLLAAALVGWILRSGAKE